MTANEPRFPMSYASDRTTHRNYSHLTIPGMEGVAVVMQHLFGNV